jgi:hypothetical protein
MPRVPEEGRSDDSPIDDAPNGVGAINEFEERTFTPRAITCGGAIFSNASAGH